MATLSPEAFYKSVLAAAKLRDRQGIAILIEGYPQYHDISGEYDSLISLLEHECPQLLEAAFAAGLSPDAGPRFSACDTYLQRCAWEGDREGVRLAIRFGADLERRNEANETALGYACAWGHLDVVKILVEAGADVNAVELPPDIPERGFTALDSCWQKPEIVDYLRAHGAKHYAELCPES